MCERENSVMENAKRIVKLAAPQNTAGRLLERRTASPKNAAVYGINRLLTEA